MSKVSHSNMNEHCNKVTLLKKNFLLQFKSDPTKGQDIIKEMRIIHGCAIYDSDVFLKNVEAKNVDSVSDDDWIKLSTNESLLSVIHGHIRTCEKLAYASQVVKKGFDTGAEKIKNIFSSDTEGAEHTDAGNVARETSFMNAAKQSNQLNQSNQSNVVTYGNKNARFRQGAEGTELSVDAGPKSETITRTQTDTVSDVPQQQSSNTGFVQSVKNLFTKTGPSSNLSDYINNLNTSDGKQLSEMYNKITQTKQVTQTGGKDEVTALDITKPTVINYWADWCGFSKKFKPKWGDFKELAKSELPTIQITELNVSNDPELDKLAKQVGVEGYPTVVFFHDGKIDKIVAGNKEAKDIVEFIKNKSA